MLNLRLFVWSQANSNSIVCLFYCLPVLFFYSVLCIYFSKQPSAQRADTYYSSFSHTFSHECVYWKHIKQEQKIFIYFIIIIFFFFRFHPLFGFMCHTEERKNVCTGQNDIEWIFFHIYCVYVVVSLCDSQPENPIVLFWDDEPNDVMTKRSSEAKREKIYIYIIKMRSGNEIFYLNRKYMYIHTYSFQS